ncbi:MAG: glycosyltransferase family 4 protein [Pseudomonadota bacterium]
MHDGPAEALAQTAPVDASALPAGTSVLIVAPNASTKFGGEAVLPVHYFRLLRQRGVDVRLLAHARNRANLEENFGPDCPEVLYIEDTAWHRILAKTGRYFPAKIRHFAFGMMMNLVNEHYQAKEIRALRAAGKLDLIHQPIPVSPKAPSSIYGFGVPVVIGPMNGGMDLPKGYEDFARASERRFESFARSLARLANRALPGKARAKTLLVANDRTRKALAVSHDNIVTLPENGVDLGTFPERGAQGPAAAPGEIRLIYLGRLVGWKAVDISLRAVALARAAGTKVTLDIVGDGPERASLEALAEELGLAGSGVIFHGFQKQQACAGYLQRADALLLNSIFECGGAVVLEAMSIGLPVIGPDWGGPADYVTPETGLLVSPIPRETFADRLAQAIIDLSADPEKRQRMGTAGIARIHSHFNWERKVDRILEIYAQAMR